VVVAGQVLDVTSFLKEHPGGALAILTFAGKDATEEFNMIHPPDVIGKYAPDAIIGMVGEGGGAAAASGGLDAPLLSTAKAVPGGWHGHRTKDYSLMEKNRKVRMQEEGKIGGWFGALCYMILGFMKEIIFTIFGQKNFSLHNDRVGLTRSAMFLFVFIVIHAIGNLHVFLGPDDFNGYGYFYVRLYWTGFGMPANIVEEYVGLAAILHVIVALKRTWDISINSTISSGRLNLAMSGVALLTFMTIHLFQFRLAETAMYKICPPPYMIDFKAIYTLHHFLNLFWTEDKNCEVVLVRDIYKQEFAVFQSFGWMLFYIASTTIFCTHMCLGWRKVIPSPAMGIPARYHNKATHIGYAMTALFGLIYSSFAIYAHLATPSEGFFGQA
jgi:hypothetical protein